MQKAHPDRFGVIKPVNANDPKVADTIADWAAMPGTVAIRIMMTPEISTDAADPGINRVLAAAAKHDLPVNMLGRGPDGSGSSASSPSATPTPRSCSTTWASSSR